MKTHESQTKTIHQTQKLSDADDEHRARGR